MSTIVCLNSGMMYVLDGGFEKNKINIKRSASFDLGVDAWEDINQNYFSEKLSDIWKNNNFSVKNVHLCLYGKSIFVNKVTAPDSSKKITGAFIDRELNKYDQFEDDDICSYIPIKNDKNNKTVTVMASKCSEKVISKVLSAFEDSGIKISSVSSGFCQLVAFFEKLFLPEKTSCIMQFCCDKNVYSIVYLSGEYIYSSSTRIEGKHGDIYFSLENARAISRILQFLKANDFEYDEENLQVFLHGFDSEDMLYCAESIGQMNPYLDVKKFDSSCVLEGIAEGVDIIAAASVYPASSTGNFISSIRNKDKRNSQIRHYIEMFMPIIATFLACSILLLATILAANSQKSRYEALQAENELYSGDIQEYESLAKANEDLKLAILEVEGKREYVESFCRPDSNFEEKICKAAGDSCKLTFTGFDGEQGRLLVTITVSSEIETSGVIEKISELDEIRQVDYEGYWYNDEIEAYVIEASLYLITENSESQSEDVGGSI